MIRAARSVTLMAMFLLLAGCFSFPDAGDGSYPESTPDEIVARLEQVIEILEDQRLSVLVNQENCRLIEYRGGTFTQHRADWCINQASSESASFTTEATSDFDRLLKTLDVGRTRFAGAGFDYGQDGKLRRATFTFTYNFGTELLVFDPGYVLPDDEPGERWHEAVDNDWYLVKVDWN